MKKIIIFILLLAICSICRVRAQSRISYNIGVKSGATMSRFVEKQINNDYWISYLLGLSLEQRFTKRLSLSYDLLYSRQGNITFFTNPGLFDQVRTTYDYLTFPFSVRYRLKRYPILLSPGLQLGFLVNNKAKFLPNNGYTNNDIPNLKKTDFGYSLSLGYRFNNFFLTELKYYQSFKTLFNAVKSIDPVTGTTVIFPPLERYNQVLSISLTFYPFLLNRNKSELKK